MSAVPYKVRNYLQIILRQFLRKDLVEEMADVLMYYNDILLCYGISAVELKQAYIAKFEKNMTRW